MKVLSKSDGSAGPRDLEWRDLECPVLKTKCTGATCAWFQQTLGQPGGGRCAVLDVNGWLGRIVPALEKFMAEAEVESK